MEQPSGCIQSMNEDRPRIYLDNAATSWPKQDVVLQAMDRFTRHCGAASGRGGYQSATVADRIVATTRRLIAKRIDAESAECISLHGNGTMALNAAIHGLLRPGDHVVSNAAEHNSVLRPLHHLESVGMIGLTIVPTDDAGTVAAEQLLDAVKPNTRLVTLTHASNVTGSVQPIAQVGGGLRDHPAYFLCDAAQTFGTLPINVRRSGIDLLAAPGHKASGGPLGTGFLYASSTVHEQLRPSIQGGTGSQSESLEMPKSMPAKLEAGNLNVPALAGWNAALETLSDAEMKSRLRIMSQLANFMLQELAHIPGVRLFGRSLALPIASIAIEGYAVGDVATILDTEFGIETRAGMHCAALIHSFLGSGPEGTLRISAGHTTSMSAIKSAIDAIRTISESGSSI